MLLSKLLYTMCIRKTLKLQEVTTADVIFHHAHGPMEGRRHNWTLCSRSGIYMQLADVIKIESKQYRIFGDCGYCTREYLEIAFNGSSPNANKLAFNKAMSGVRIAVDWVPNEVKMHWTALDYQTRCAFYNSR